MKPPYGRITAYDMNKGEIAWQIAERRHAARHQEQSGAQGTEHSRTGSPSHAGLLVTKTLLFAGEGWGGQPVFRAYDKATGTDRLGDADSRRHAGRPAHDVHSQGRQYIAFMAGDAATSTPAQLVSFAIPPPPAVARPAGKTPGAGQQ